MVAQAKVSDAHISRLESTTKKKTRSVSSKKEDDAFERERKIVEEEWRRDIGPDKKYQEALYKVTHKNSLLEKRKPIGKIEVIRNFKYQDVKELNCPQLLLWLLTMISIMAP